MRTVLASPLPSALASALPSTLPASVAAGLLHPFEYARGCRSAFASSVV